MKVRLRRWVTECAALCKNAGYKQFGFRNEGQCVAFVNRGTRR